ncbi:solute carrier family 49 member A3-like [Glandiceps talaboti]
MEYPRSDTDSDPSLSSPTARILSDEDGCLPSSGDEENSDPVQYRLYKKRWFVLFLATFLGFSNDVVWLSFSPAASVLAEYYNVSTNSINLVSLLHIFIPVPTTFIATWLLDTYGLRPSLLIGSLFMAIGSIIQLISTLHIIPSSWQFAVAAIGQVFAATVSPIFNISPTKISEKWFGERERSLATMINTASYGLVLGNLLTPILVKYKGVQFMFIMYSLPPVLGLFLTIFGLTSSAPPTPPSPSAAVKLQPYWTGLKQMLKNKQFLILMVLLGLESGLFDTLTIVGEEMLCTHGYTPTFSGIVMGVQSGVGFFGALVASLYVDRTKLFEETTKVMYALSAISTALMMTVSAMPHMEVLIIITNIMYGVFSSAAYPVSMELAVETTYPGAEATSFGLISMATKIEGIIFTFVMEALSRPMTNYEKIHQKCVSIPTHGNNQLISQGSTKATAPKDMTVAMMVYSSLYCFQAIALIVFFKTDYKRLNAEKAQHAKDEASVNVDSIQDNVANT